MNATPITVFSAGRNVRLLPGTELTGSHRMAFGDDVFVGRDAQIMIALDRPEPGPMIVFGQGTSINRRALIVAANQIVFGRYVLTAPGIYVADASHEYRSIGIPVTMQGIESDEKRVEIGDHCWLGIHVAIVGNVRVGRGSVLAANAVINRDVPDYCVVAGQPGRVVRAYDHRVREWVKIGSLDHLDDVVANGRRHMPPDVWPPPAPRLPIYAGPMVTIS